MGDLGMSSPVVQSGGKLHPRTPSAGQGGNRLLMGRRVLLALLSAAVLVGLMAQPGAAVNVPQPAVVSSNPADWTPHVLDGKVAAIVQVGNKIVAGGSFTRINGVAQKSLVKLRLSDGARITAFKGKTNARVKDMAVSGGRLYIGGTFKTANGVARSALAAVDPVTRGALGRCQPGLHRPPQRHRQHRQARHQPRRQPDGRHRQLDLRGRPAARPDRHAQPGHQPISVTDWATTRYQQQCAKVFDTYMRDVDISPDGSYFVVGTTGAFRAGSLCDAAARWERGASGSGQQPTWVDYTGGDTLYSIAFTGMTVRDFDGTTAGFTTPIALNGLTSTQFPISRITGMFSWNGRLYYTLSGDTRLYYRWFTPESGVPGADTFVASGAGDGRNWSTVSGMTMASGRLGYATTTGNLSAVDFTNGVPTGAATVLSGPAVDGQSWQSRGAVRPLSASRSGPHPGGCGPDPFRYPAPRQPL